MLGPFYFIEAAGIRIFHPHQYKVMRPRESEHWFRKMFPCLRDKVNNLQEQVVYIFIICDNLFSHTQFSSIFASNFSSSATALLMVWLLSLMSAINSANVRLSSSPPCLIQVISKLVLSRFNISSIG